MDSHSIMSNNSDLEQKIQFKFKINRKKRKKKRERREEEEETESRKREKTDIGCKKIKKNTKRSDRVGGQIHNECFSSEIERKREREKKQQKTLGHYGERG